MKRMLAGLATIVALLGSAAALGSPAQAVDPSVPPKMSAADKPMVGKTGLKGRPGKTAAASKASLLPAPVFLYNEGHQRLTAPQYAAGLAVNMIISAPYTQANDHSLQELSVADPTEKHSVELGITVDPNLFGDSNPHLFAFWWKNGVPQCYNGCGFVDYAANPINVGDSLAGSVGLQKRLEIQVTSTAWWLRYDNQWLGYYPLTLWSAATPSGPGVTFNQGNYFQVFGEVASLNSATPKTDMGNGQFGTPNTAVPVSARLGSYQLVGQSPSTVVSGLTIGVIPSTASGAYNVYPISTLSFGFGGPGYSATGTLPGTVGS